MVMTERPAKRLRRRVTADLPDFFTFPQPHSDVAPPQPFRESVRSFLIRHAHVTCPSSSLFPSLVTSQISLRVGHPGDPTAVLPLDVVEEDVTRSRRSVYCDQCRVVGESTHPLSVSLIDVDIRTFRWMLCFTLSRFFVFVRRICIFILSFG